MSARRTVFGLVATAMALTAMGEEPRNPPIDAELRRGAERTIERAIAFYRSAQNPDGSFVQGEFGPPITGLAVTGLLRTRRVTVADPMIARALTYLEKHVQPDGGIYAKGGQKTYPTSVGILAFVEANHKGRYQTVIDNAVAFLKKDQWDEGEGITPSDHRYGGVGYGKHSRPDLSNTSFMLEALRSAGLPKDDPAFQRALVFVTRCQNLSGEGANDLPQGALVNDGGIYYTPAESQAGGSVTGGLRSYASMTYAGLKSFLYAGVDKKDRRVQAALAWVRKHYTVSANPGLDQQGLYYYYHTFAKALAVLEIDVLVDDQGRPHQWRNDLLKVLIEKQNADGSWTNPNRRWLEDEPRLVTAYVLLALAQTLAAK